MHYLIVVFFFASCIIATISASDLKLVDVWLNLEGLNIYGDGAGTVYSRDPLTNVTTGERIDRSEYLTTKFPELPWLDIPDSWLNRQGLNKYGDSVDTMYTGGSPLFNEYTGESVDRYLYLTIKFPSLPWFDNYYEEKEGSKNVTTATATVSSAPSVTPTPLDEGDACVDTVGGFPNWKGYGNARNCEFVEESWTMLKCLFYGDHCPETCGRTCD